MWLPGAQGQNKYGQLYRADVTLSGSSATFVMGASVSRSMLMLQNTGSHVMYVEIGCGRATATLTSGAVSSISVTNAGFNFTKPPLVRLRGGGPPGGSTNSPNYNSSYTGLAQPNAMAPSNIATAHAVLSSGTIGSFVVDNGGANYLVAPYVDLIPSDLDPNGCSTPSTTSGILLPATMATPIAWNGTACPTGAIAVIGTSGDTLFCGWME